MREENCGFRNADFGLNSHPLSFNPQSAIRNLLSLSPQPPPMSYPPTLTLREALDIFFKKYNLGEEGGLNKNWAYLDFGYFRLPFPNTASRKKALMFHDIHHIAAGYESDWRGEAEIAAWEISTGCGSYTAAWVLDIGGLAMGLCFFPIVTYRAFIRGQRTLNLYHHTLTREQAVSMTIGELQNKLLLDKPDPHPASAKELFSFITWAVISLAAGFTCFVLPFILLGWWLMGIDN
jgi:hypothetical protein